MTALIRPGARIRNADLHGTGSSPDDYAGTLGALVRSRRDLTRLFVLTAGHVLNAHGYGSDGQPVQAWDGQQWVKIAEYEAGTLLRDAPGATHDCDACIARVTMPSLLSPEIQSLGLPTGQVGVVWADMGLRFNGATSGPTTARVYTPPGSVDLELRDDDEGTTARLSFLGQILYGSDEGSRQRSATRPGDSGALVVDAFNTVVGLHIASTPELEASVCTPIQVVLDRFDVELVLTEFNASGAVQPAPAVAAAPLSAIVRTTDPDAVSQQAFQDFGALTRSLLVPHNPFGGVTWALTPQGVVVDGRLDRTGGAPVTVRRVWDDFGVAIVAAAAEFKVPVELIVATICTESGGKPDAIRIEPGWTSDTATPERVSVGLMQTLISSARDALAVDNKVAAAAIHRASLMNPDLSIRAGAAFIRNQRPHTAYDAPLVACAYNAGRLAVQNGAANRWKLRQYPIGTGHHADRFVQWFNDCFACLDEQPSHLPPDTPSFWRLFR